jgi:Uma2 family endonuclease
MDRRTLLTAKDLEQMPEDDSVRLELLEGELITMPPAGGDHGYLGLEIGAELRSFVKPRKLGRVYGSDAGFRLNEDTVLAPDASFVRQDRVEAVHRRGFNNGAPDLAVEVVSPSNTLPELMRKIRQYFKAGCHTVWMLDHDRREVQVFEASGNDRTLRPGDSLECPELLPGFSLPVTELFES